MTDVTPPWDAGHLLIDPAVAQRIDTALPTGQFVGGWILSGPPQIGKATLAYAIAKALLSGTYALGQSDATTDALISNAAHPDLFTLRRAVNEKTGKLRSEIDVNQVRAVSGALHQTSTTGRRVVIIDLADDLGRAAANALLKTLEEPPAQTTMLLLSSAPGRLLPTIKSRCRRISLAPLPEPAMTEWIAQRPGVASADIPNIVEAANGLPGRAVTMLEGDAGSATRFADQFFSAVNGSTTDLLTAATAVTSKDAEVAWDDTRRLILERISKRIRQTPDHPHTLRYLKVYDDVAKTCARGEALNSDRQHLIVASGLALRSAGWPNAH